MMGICGASGNLYRMKFNMIRGPSKPTEFQGREVHQMEIDFSMILVFIKYTRTLGKFELQQRTAMMVVTATIRIKGLVP
jgi:hypothetical protein